MSAVKITVDSTCDLSPELVEKHDITVIPLYTILGDKSYADGREIQPEGIYEFVAKNNVLPKTSAASVDDYLQIFKKYTDAGMEVIHFSISSDMSSSYQNAVIAAQELGGVYVVDSMNLSTGSGLLVLDAADYREQGLPASEIAKLVREHVPLVRASFVIDNLDYLRMGGRCSAVAVLGANLLKIKPRIEVKNGKMGMGGKYRGMYDKVSIKYAEDMLSLPNINTRRVFVTHTKCDESLINQVVETVKSLVNFEELLVTTAGCVITSHCGPNTLGVLFEVKKQ